MRRLINLLDLRNESYAHWQDSNVGHLYLLQFAAFALKAMINVIDKDNWLAMPIICCNLRHIEKYIIGLCVYGLGILLLVFVGISN